MAEVCGPCNEEMYRSQTCDQFSLFMQSGQNNHSCNSAALKRITNGSVVMCQFKTKLSVSFSNKYTKLPFVNYVSLSWSLCEVEIVRAESQKAKASL